MLCLHACASVEAYIKHADYAYLVARCSLMHPLLARLDDYSQLMSPCLGELLIVAPSPRLLAQLAGPHTMCITCAPFQLQLFMSEHADVGRPRRSTLHQSPYVHPCPAQEAANAFTCALARSPHTVHQSSPPVSQDRPTLLDIRFRGL